MAYSFSKTWKSAQRRIQEAKTPGHRASRSSERGLELIKFRAIIPALQGIYKERQAMVPWTFEQWLNWRAEVAEHEQHQLKHKLDMRQLERDSMTSLKENTGQSHLRLFDGARPKPEGHLPDGDWGKVLSWPTMWCENWWLAPDRQGVLFWPDAAERKWEGDDRVHSKDGPNYGRFSGRVRWMAPGFENLAWYDRPPLPEREFDRVWLPKTMEDILLPPDPIGDEEGILMVGSEMMDAISNPL